MVESAKGADAHIRCRTIIEVLGKPKEHVEKAISEYIGHIKEDSGLVVLAENYSEAKDQGKLWSKFVELDLVIKGTSKLITFCFEYMPSSLEVLKPEHIILTNPEISNFLNDLQARLHNAVLICLKVSSLSMDQLSQITGVDKKELETFTENLLKENKIKKEGEIYSLV